MSSQKAKIDDTRKVTPAQAEPRVRRCFHAKRPVFLWGPPGIGKSDLVQGIADAMAEQWGQDG